MQAVSEPLRLRDKHMHKRCLWKNRIWNELCQEQHKCRQTNHRLLHVDAEDEKSLQTARPAEPAEPPNRLRKSMVCSRAKASRDVPAAGKRGLTTFGCRQVRQGWRRRRRRAGSVALVQTTAGEPQHSDMWRIAGDTCNIRGPEDCTVS